jgi:hypothetical protein
MTFSGRDRILAESSYVVSLRIDQLSPFCDEFPIFAVWSSIEEHEYMLLNESNVLLRKWKQ